MTPSEKLVERVRDYIYDCTRDEFGHGWVLSAEQAEHVIKLASIPTPEASEQLQDVGAIPGSRASTEPVSRLGPSGFDPERKK
jgi:hypothetical protein